ncbi:hypothetical protein B4N89_44215 [Embleya scabrispora]|uniref:Uncharacterized protein n=1 Tax=Embleya scabrispora TaxID=159449 RepID=A0A1T3NL05_9ACTN|nr:hypothetical protein [Embleya scabrispora]OPC77506.1 hypothetical protein B4N89_44215 [Embleya scabrispora]
MSPAPAPGDGYESEPDAAPAAVHAAEPDAVSDVAHAALPDAVLGVRLAVASDAVLGVRSAVVSDAVIDDYLRRVAAELTGTRARRRAILDEALDGLLAAAEAHLEDCGDPEEAGRRAVAEWGSPTTVAEAYNAATGRRRARRQVLTALGALPALASVWSTAMLTGPAGPWERRPPVLDAGLGLLAFGTVLAAASALSGLRAATGPRAALPDAAPPLREAATATFGVLLVLATLLMLVVNRGVTAPASLAWPLIAPAAVLNIALAAHLTGTWRRLRAHRPVRPRRP